METLLIVLVLLVATRLGGLIATRLGQPMLVGELIAGVALGLILAGFTLDPALIELGQEHHVMALTDLGIFFLMLLGGLEMRPRELVESGVRSMVVATCAMVLPLSAGFFVAWLWLPSSDLRFAQALFVGTALSITAVPVTIRVLMDMNRLNTRIGRLIVSAAVFDDLLSLVLLSILTATLGNGQFLEGLPLALIPLRVLAFVVLVYALGTFLMPPLARFVVGLGVEEMGFSFILVIGALFSLLAELLGLHFILGAFAAGLFFGRETVNSQLYDDLRHKVAAITNGFLAPIFFASIGLELELSAIREVPLFLLILIIVAFLGKLLGAALPARLFGIPAPEAWAIGTAMSARGAVELIIAGIALRAGLFDAGAADSAIVANLFSVVVLVAIVTTIAAPIGLRLALLQAPRAGGNGPT
ncbi:cation:proton antiporter [Halomonas beimenensis]|nr:cation:proton antiporter [Halomonas beimenensis]